LLLQLAGALARHVHFEVAMGLISSRFPHAHGADSRSTSVPPLNLEGDRSQSLVDDKRLSTSETVAHSGSKTFATRSKDVNEDLHLDEEIWTEVGFEGIVGQSSALRQALRLIETVATGDSTVLVLGETGTGKELIARAIHNRSRRKERNFVRLNCAAVPTGLLESELFGHKRGAFAGAIAQRVGRLELADRGSLFLDEIGDIPLELQTKLQRVLQEREFERLDSTRTQRVDFRVIAATHRDLEWMIAEKRFRTDLYCRLNVFPITIPPLRERPGDIPELVRHFVQRAARRMNQAIDTIPCETMDALKQYPWPGNIRELENVIERAVILSPNPALRVPIRDHHTRVASGRNRERSQTLEEVERKHIVTTLKDARWVLSGSRGTARRLGIKRSTLYFRMKKLGILRSVESQELEMRYDGALARRVRFELCAAIALIKMKAGRRATSQSKKCSASWRLCQNSHRPAVLVQQDAPLYEQAECFNSELATHIPILTRGRQCQKVRYPHISLAKFTISVTARCRGRK
jgi:DNA-binding NtrC family response regulator